jgi:hypothetical protein
MTGAGGDSETGDDSGTETGTFRAEFDAGKQTASEALLASVANVTGRDLLELPPLYDVVDPEALDTLFSRPRDGEARTDRRLDIEYAECLITVRSRGVVLVTPTNDDGDA